MHRLLSVLEAEGLVARDTTFNGEPRNSAYRLGPTLVSLGGLALRQINLRAIALPHLRALAQKSGETVDLELLVGRRSDDHRRSAGRAHAARGRGR